MDPIVARAEASETSFDTYMYSLSSWSQIYRIAVDDLQENHRDLTETYFNEDEQQSIIPSMNCRGVGSGLEDMAKFFCKTGVYYLYLFRFLFGAIAFGLLFLMCCGVCAGARFYRHSGQTSRVHNGDQFNPEESHERIDQFYPQESHDHFESPEKPPPPRRGGKRSSEFRIGYS